MATGDNPPPINRNLPPFGRSIAAGGIVSQSPVQNRNVQHPNPAHGPRGAATPMAGLAAQNFSRGQPKRRPPHSAPGGLRVGVRK